jgi:hypothetical protein
VHANARRDDGRVDARGSIGLAPSEATERRSVDDRPEMQDEVRRDGNQRHACGDVKKVVAASADLAAEGPHGRRVEERIAVGLRIPELLTRSQGGRMDAALCRASGCRQCDAPSHRVGTIIHLPGPRSCDRSSRGLGIHRWPVRRSGFRARSGCRVESRAATRRGGTPSPRADRDVIAERRREASERPRGRWVDPCTPPSLRYHASPYGRASLIAHVETGDGREK